jgi:HEAT repeat protein
VGSDDLFESEPAIDGLAALGPAVIPVLEASYGREGAPARRGFIEVLRQIDAPEIVPLLLRAARDPDDEVRHEAILGLGDSKDERARPIVEAALHDPAPAVRDAAVQACSAVCASPSALRHLVEIALHEQPFLRISIPRQTLRVILRGGTDSQVSVAREAIEAMALPLLRSDAGTEERVRAALLTADLRNPAAIPWLTDALEQGVAGVDKRLDPLIKMEVIRALGSVGDEESVDVLVRMSRRPMRAVQGIACEALAQLAQRGVARATVESRRCTVETAERG